jgi:hypothetical protein
VFPLDIGLLMGVNTNFEGKNEDYNIWFEIVFE